MSKVVPSLPRACLALAVVGALGAIGARGVVAFGSAAGSGAVADQAPPPSVSSAGGPVVHGMTISTRTSGHEWGGPDFAAELDRLVELGVNWIAIHPYAGLGRDGRLHWRRWEGDVGPSYLASAIEAAHARGLEVLVKPHLAYWGTDFAWRGDIEFEDPETLDAFWHDLEEWTVALAGAASAADGFSVGCELSRLDGDAARWRGLIAKVRAETPAQLTYAANWDRFGAIEFWEALDAVGVQAYFPLEVGKARDAEGAFAGLPTVAGLEAAWAPHLAELERVAERTGKPVVFLELGYDRHERADVEPWRNAWEEPTARATELQRRLLVAAFGVLERERAWLRGAFLWKWFVHGNGHEDFALDHDGARATIGAAWAAAE